MIRKEVSTDEAAESMGKYQERIEKERKWLVMLKGKDENIIPLLGCYMLNDKASFLFLRLEIDLGGLLRIKKTFTVPSRHYSLRSPAQLGFFAFQYARIEVAR